ncbi:MAG: hypothetical protein OIF36_03215 [Alphaproteobacteria bacterium]|nr:hypothetical protein [Alphaproteobacteria bacterium]
MSSVLTVEDKKIINRLSEIENFDNYKPVSSKILKQKLRYEFEKIHYTLDRLYNYNNEKLEIKNFPIQKIKNTKQNKYYFYMNPHKKCLQWVSEELRKDHGEPDFIPENWKSTVLLANILKISNNRLYTEVKRIYENKNSWDPQKEGFEFPIKEGQKINKKYTKGYYLNPDKKVMEWFKNIVNKSLKNKTKRRVNNSFYITP